MLIGLISEENESAYRWKVVSCLPGAARTFKIVVDFRKSAAPPFHIILCNFPVLKLYLLPHQDGTTDNVLLVAAEAVQPAKDNDGSPLLHIIESILIFFSVWHAPAIIRDKCRWQHVNHCSERLIGCHLPSLQELHAFGTWRWARKVAADPSHIGHKLLHFGRTLQSIRTKTSCQKSSFSYLQLASLTRQGFSSDTFRLQYQNTNLNTV